jgi:hypothetical protein
MGFRLEDEMLTIVSIVTIMYVSLFTFILQQGLNSIMQVHIFPSPRNANENANDKKSTRNRNPSRASLSPSPNSMYAPNCMFAKSAYGTPIQVFLSSYC